jgi:O-methyltransferase
MALTAMIQKALRKLGVEVHLAASGGSYTLNHPYGQSTYSPWFEEEFQRLHREIRDRTLVTEDRCYLIHRLSQHALHLDGDFAECGVYKGGTAALIARTLKDASATNRTLHLFDTFEGMPDVRHESIHRKGDFGDTTLESVIEYLNPFPFVSFHPGLMPETFAGVRDRRFAFAHVDVDIYQSMWDSCDFFYPRLCPGGILLFDDYGLPAYRLDGKRAVDDFFGGKPEIPIVLKSGQCLVIKL